MVVIDACSIRDPMNRRQTSSTTLFRCLNHCGTGEKDNKDNKGAGSLSNDAGEAALTATLQDYFQLEESLSHLYRAWSEGDSRMATVARCFPGVRVVR